MQQEMQFQCISQIPHLSTIYDFDLQWMHWCDLHIYQGITKNNKGNITQDKRLKVFNINEETDWDMK